MYTFSTQTHVFFSKKQKTRYTCTTGTGTGMGTGTSMGTGTGMGTGMGTGTGMGRVWVRYGHKTLSFHKLYCTFRFLPMDHIPPQFLALL